MKPESGAERTPTSMVVIARFPFTVEPDRDWLEEGDLPKGLEEIVAKIKETFFPGSTALQVIDQVGFIRPSGFSINVVTLLGDEKEISADLTRGHLKMLGKMAENLEVVTAKMLSEMTGVPGRRVRRRLAEAEKSGEAKSLVRLDGKYFIERQEGIELVTKKVRRGRPPNGGKSHNYVYLLAKVKGI